MGSLKRKLCKEVSMLNPIQEVTKIGHIILVKMLSQLKSVSLSILTAVSLVFGLIMVSSVQAQEITIDRTYTVTKVDVPKQCELDNFKTTCARLVNLYARRFEREMVLYKNNQYDFDNLHLSLDHSQTRATQKVKMSIYTAKEDDPVFTLFTFIEQFRPGQKSNILVETINFDAQTGQSIEFKQLFQKPDLAAMLCARKIQDSFKSLDSPLLPVVISATELSPSNYMITPFGLRFFFAPGLVNFHSRQADSLLVSLEDLADAKPVEKWWADKDRTITDDQLKALENSKLSDVINIEENYKVSGQSAVAQSEAKGIGKSKMPIIKGTASADTPKQRKN